MAGNRTNSATSKGRNRNGLQGRMAVVLVGLFVSLVGLPSAHVAATPAIAPAGAPARIPLTNLAHLDFLSDTVSPPTQEGHTTYRLETEPDLGAVWTYADRRNGGVYERVGGGPYDAATNTWGQGAYNADDLSRAAVVYLRHWQQFGDAHSREQAYQLLRTLTYLQTVTGENAGNVVLWMQPDGTLNPSPEPVELPDPSDSGESCWLARTIWALGEGLAVFEDEDPQFASFLEDRLDLALGAVEEQVLSDYGTSEVADGKRVPAWLIVDGADATAEAILGLRAFVDSSPDNRTLRNRARTAMGRLAEGVAAMGSTGPKRWPYGAILPWTQSRSIWHAWASQMPAALAGASTSLDRPGLLAPAVRDAAVFTPYLLTSTGVVNGLLPGPSDRTQIAYGVDSRVQSLLAVGEATGRPGFEALTAITAAWYFGANPAGEAMYDPSTGRTYDGVSGAGEVNRNSGAESTIHGLLSMLALDAHPGVAETVARDASVLTQDGVSVVEAESAQTSGDASVVTPDPAWTGESLWSGSYLALPARSTARWQVPAADQPRVVSPVVDVAEGKGSPRLRWFGDHRSLGSVATGGVGEQGITPAPGALLPLLLRRELPAGDTQVRTSAHRGSGSVAKLDSLLLRPVVSQLVLEVAGGGQALLQNAHRKDRMVEVSLPGSGPVSVRVYDERGRLVSHRTKSGATIDVRVAGHGFAVLRR